MVDDHPFFSLLADAERGSVSLTQVLGLERTRVLLEALGHPDQQMHIVHIAGTKGKGSTAAMIAAALTSAGITTGLYTSPHLVDYQERVRVNGWAISNMAIEQVIETHLAPAVQAVRARLGIPPTRFEVELGLALSYFRQQAVRVAVLEVGLGGRLDATNAISDPTVSVITLIGHDHMQVLGPTLTDIAREKAGIIRAGGRVVCAPQPDMAMSVIVETCHRLSAHLTAVSDVWQWRIIDSDVRRIHLAIENPLGFPDVYLPLIGRHQAANAITALAALRELAELYPQLTPQLLVHGIENVRWPGRCQVIGQRPLTILDGAHNKESMEALSAVIDDIVPQRPLVVVFGTQSDKDIAAIARSLVNRATHLVLTRSTHPHSASLEALQQELPEGTASIHIHAVPLQAFAHARQLAGHDGAILVTGSLYVVGDVLRGLGIAPAQHSLITDPH